MMIQHELNVMEDWDENQQYEAELNTNRFIITCVSKQVLHRLYKKQKQMKFTENCILELIVCFVFFN